MKSGFLKHLKDLIKPSNSIKQQPKDDLAKENDESQNQTTRNHELSIVSMRILVARFNKERRKRELKKLKKREKKKEKAKKKREKKRGWKRTRKKIRPNERVAGRSEPEPAASPKDNRFIRFFIHRTGPNQISTAGFPLDRHG